MLNKFNFVRLLIDGQDRIEKKVDLLQKELKVMADQFTQDVEALTAQVTANTVAINQFVALVAANTATIAALNQEIADLKAAHPAIDLSGLEAQVAALTANNAEAQAALTPAPPPVV